MQQPRRGSGASAEAGETSLRPAVSDRVASLRRCAPPSGAIEFVDSSGTHMAMGHVTVVAPGASCQHAQVLHTGLGDTMVSEGARAHDRRRPDGHARRPELDVTLTLNSRDSLLSRPVLATVFLLALAMALPYVVDPENPAAATRVSLDTDKIGGLEDWVAKAQAHSSLAAVAAQERWMRRTGGPKCVTLVGA
jgi:hypothetical protein